MLFMDWMSNLIKNVDERQVGWALVVKDPALINEDGADVLDTYVVGPFRELEHAMGYASGTRDQIQHAEGWDIQVVPMELPVDDTDLEQIFNG